MSAGAAITVLGILTGKILVPVPILPYVIVVGITVFSLGTVQFVFEQLNKS